MKLTPMIFLSLDGVHQGPGGPDEDRQRGFGRGGWKPLALGPLPGSLAIAFLRS